MCDRHPGFLHIDATHLLPTCDDSGHSIPTFRSHLTASRACKPARPAPPDTTLPQAEKLRVQIQAFFDNVKEQELALPPSLSSFERMLAHQIAGELGDTLDHLSLSQPTFVVRTHAVALTFLPPGLAIRPG